MIYLNSEKFAIITSNWALSSVGNYSIFNYYNGVAPENPSGNKNIESISMYDKGDLLKHKVVFAYDLDDDIIKQKSV